MEALICLAFFFALTATALGTANKIGQSGQEGNELLELEAKSQKCALTADILFSNGGGHTEISEKCFAGKAHEVKSSLKGKEKSAFTIAEKINSKQEGGRTVMEVEVGGHYR